MKRISRMCLTLAGVGLGLGAGVALWSNLAVAAEKLVGGRSGDPNPTPGKKPGRPPEAPKQAAKPPEPPLFTSPDVTSDGKVTFRLWAPQAKEVTVFGDFGWDAKSLRKSPDGVWATTLALPPGIWGYTFSIDGQKQIDPANAWVKPSRLPTTSVVLVPAQPAALYEHQGAPEGAVHLHSYAGASSPESGGVAASGSASVRRLRVYTPPGYNKGSARYPVLYLLHGFSDNEAGWTEFGRAHVMADNLLAAQRIVPAIIVMTDGHAIPISRERWQANLEAYQQDMLKAVIPFVEERYRTKKGAAQRAIVGLSMGGEQALSLGINNPDVFGWVGGMSSATRHLEVFDLSRPEDLNKKLNLLWIAVGKDDFLIEHNRSFVKALEAKGIRHEYKETEGAHTWAVWRDYLVEVLPRLFKPKAKNAR